MILLNWNSFSLAALASLNSSSWDVLGVDQSGILEQRGFHCLSIFWSLETSGQGPGESRVGAGNEVVMNIFHILRDKTGPIDLGMKNAFFLFFFTYYLLFGTEKNLNCSKFPILFFGCGVLGSVTDVPVPCM